MLRNMKVGTKLLAVVLPPLIVLVAVALIGARDRLDEADDARTAEQYIELVRSGNEVLAELQSERSLSVLQATEEVDVADQLSSQRSATDAVTAEFAALVADLPSGSPIDEPATRAAGRYEADIATIRASVDRGGIDPLIVYEWYVASADNQLNLATEISNEVPFVEVTADLNSTVALSRAVEAQAKRNTIMALALGRQEFDESGRLWREDFTLGQEATRYTNLFLEIALAEQAATVRRVEQSPAMTQLVDMREAVIALVTPTVDIFGDGSLLTANPAPLTTSTVGAEVDLGGSTPAAHWLTLADAQITALSAPNTAILDGVAESAEAVRSEAESQALLFLLVTAAAVIISAVLAIVVARRITKPLRNLTDAADRLSGEQLPALVERLKSPGAGTGEVILEPINMKRSDEIGHLADAFDAIQRVTVEVAEEQASLLKKGIGDIFVNLARRNQTLLDRQIEFIDQLESQEEDPDVLEDLFKLDHLATRMRRNAESLLVLAGIETGHRRSRPVPLSDVVRVAVGEVEDFARLNLVAMDDAVVTGAAAMDVAHLLSELMENATAFSPPETTVEVLGHQNADGSYVLSISDQGIGMSDEQFSETNKLLAEPPLVGLTLSRSLGFTVVGRLAARFKIDVRLTSSPTGGVTALVTLPTTILESSTITVDEQPAAPAPAVVEPVVEHQAPFAQPPVAEEPREDLFAPAEHHEPEPVPAPDWVSDAPAPATLATAVPEGAAFDAGLAALIGEETRDDEPTEAAPAVEETYAPEPVAADEPAPAPEPVRTSAGLVKRVPRATTVTEPDARPSSEAPVARTQRSPEEVRAMLSRYRSGLHRGREADSPTGDETN